MINITINSFNTELTKDDRVKLFPTIGKLHPDGTSKLARVDDYDQVKLTIEAYPVCPFPCDVAASNWVELQKLL